MGDFGDRLKLQRKSFYSINESPEFSAQAKHSRQKSVFDLFKNVQKSENYYIVIHRGHST